MLLQLILKTLTTYLIFYSHFGHDKSIELRQYSSLPKEERPIMFYAGDGVSDLSAAKETDLLFAKKGHGKKHECCKMAVSNTIQILLLTA